MARFTSVVSKLNCFNNQRNPDKHVPFPHDDYDEFQCRGQQILRSMFAQSEQQGKGESWAAAIQKFEQEEQERIHYQRMNNIRHLNRALERRRRFDNDGSFSINMVTFKAVDVTKPIHKAPSSVSNKSYLNCSNYDDRSSASTKSNVSMHVIDEDIEF
jgi:hypothetical protein